MTIKELKNKVDSIITDYNSLSQEVNEVVSRYRHRSDLLKEVSYCINVSYNNMYLEDLSNELEELSELVEEEDEI